MIWVMDQESIKRYITSALDGVEVVSADGNDFFFYGSQRMMPFATIVANDLYDKASDLGRAGVFRLNVGVGKETYRELLGAQPKGPGPGGVVETGDDFTALDRIMPHPVYGHLSWVCVLNPSEVTFERVKGLLAEAHGIAARRGGRGREEEVTG